VGRVPSQIRSGASIRQVVSNFTGSQRLRHQALAGCLEVRSKHAVATQLEYSHVNVRAVTRRYGVYLCRPSQHYLTYARALGTQKMPLDF